MQRSTRAVKVCYHATYLEVSRIWWDDQQLKGKIKKGKVLYFSNCQVVKKQKIVSSKRLPSPFLRLNWMKN